MIPRIVTVLSQGFFSHTLVLKPSSSFAVLRLEKPCMLGSHIAA